jgi:hypothetical protein
MTPRPRRVEPSAPHPARPVAWRAANHERDRQLHDGAGRQREQRRQLAAARRDDDDPETA